MRQTLRKHGRDNRIFGSDPIPPSPWNYVGGAGTAEPPFENGWDNAGGGLQRLRFRVTNEDQLEVEGVVTGGTAPVVTTLPDLDAHFRDSVFWPGETAYAVGALGTADLAIWKLDTNGELSIAGTVASSSMGTAELNALGYLHWGSNTDAGTAGLFLTTTANFELTAADVEVAATAGDVTVSSVGNVSLLVDSLFSVLATAGIDLSLNNTGISLTVYDSGTNPIFRVDEDGSVHIKTGGSIIADL